MDEEVALDALDEWMELGSRGIGRVMLGVQDHCVTSEELDALLTAL